MKAFFSLFVLLASSVSFAAAGLTIYSAEIGVGKFHRKDNSVHAYPASNAWAPFVLPANAGTQTPQVYENSDGSISIFFSNLEELLTTAAQEAAKRNKKIQVLNLNGHGMPGGMWYPKNAAQLASSECSSWVEAAQAPDQANYDQYYEPVSKFEIFQLKQTQYTPAHYDCVAGLPEWTEVVNANPSVKQAFADDAEIHFLSCLVGLGPVGEQLTTGIAQLLLGNKGVVKSILQFGLGDWSMPEGLGFWDYQNDDQLNHDNAIYPVDRSDREIMQKGTIRVVSFANNKWGSNLVADQDFMNLGKGFASPVVIVPEPQPGAIEALPPAIVRIPGTGVWASRH